MIFKIFTLHPQIFTSFLSESLVSRAVSKDIMQVHLINWREYGISNYKSVDDKPFGGGSGMVLTPEPIYRALQESKAISSLFKVPSSIKIHQRIQPNNQDFAKAVATSSNKIKKATIMLSPRGYRYNQKTAQWLSNFEELNILCGRYEGFDARVSEIVDMEISIGDFILNGGEVGAMSIIESVGRLIPDYITKVGSVLHDSFSEQLNWYAEQEEYIVGKESYLTKSRDGISVNPVQNPFILKDWIQHTLPFIEHPQYSRPEVWKNYAVPAVLLGGNHKSIQAWRANDWKI